MNMMSLLLSTSLIRSADAGSPYLDELVVPNFFSAWDKGDYFGNVDSAELVSDSGAVDVPIYRNGMAPTNHTVLVNVGTPGADTESEESETAKSPAQFSFNLHSSTIVISEGFAKEHGLDISVTNKRLIPVPDDFMPGGEIKTTIIPALTISDDAGQNHLVLKDVTAFIADSKTKNITGGLKRDTLSAMTIGLGALNQHGLAYAYLPSQGTFRFVSSAEGKNLLSSVSDKPIAYKSTDWEIGRLKKWTLSGKNESILPALTLLVPFSLNETAEEQKGTRYAYIKLDSTSVIDSYLSGAVNSTIKAKGKQWDHLAVNIGDGSEVASLGNIYAHRTLTSDVSAPYPEAILGLRHFDIAVDPATSMLAIKANTLDENSFKDLRLHTLAEAEQALSDADKPGDKEAESKPALPAGELNELISQLEGLDRYQQTLTHYQRLLSDNEERTDCSIWQRYGETQLRLGNYADALIAFQEATDLYHSWWDFSLHDRMDINNRQADAMKRDTKNKNTLMVDSLKALSDENEAANGFTNTVQGGWFYAQPDSCQVADGLIAQIHFINGDVSKAEEVYREELDNPQFNRENLDDGLARVFGNAALSSGNTAVAHEAYRQALKREDGNSSENRMGLALVYADQGQWGQADQLFREAFSIEHIKSSVTSGAHYKLFNVLASQVWADQLRAAKGSEAVINSLNELILLYPGNSSFKIALLREYMLGDSVSSELQTAQERLATIQAVQEANRKKRRRNRAAVDQEELNNLTERINELMALSKDTLSKRNSVADDLRGELKGSPSLLIIEPLLKTYSGDTEGALSAIEAMEARSDDRAMHIKVSPLWEVVKANVYSAKGDKEAASTALKRAGALNSFDPVYGLLLAQ